MDASVEISVHLESFRNIDLLSQGVYQFRFEIYTVKDSHVLEPIPKRKTSARAISSFVGDRPPCPSFFISKLHACIYV